MIQQAKALQDRGAEVLVITLHGPGTKSHEHLEGVEVVRPRYMFPEKLEFLQNVGGGLPAVWQKQPLSRLIFIPFLISQTLAIMYYGRKADIIHVHWTLAALAAWLGAFYHRRPYVVTIHGSEIYQLKDLWWGRTLNRFALSRCKKVIAITRALAQAAIEQGVPPHLIEIVPDGINLEKFRPSEKEHEPFVLYCGSLIPRKGINYLLEAMLPVLAKFPEYRLVLVGTGPERDNLNQQAQSLGIAQRIDFIGGQSQDQVRDWMQRARIFVLPSLDEALGIVLLEAQACGTPCVATRVGGIPEMVSPDSGILVPPADPQSIAQAILTLLSDKDLWRIYSQNGRSWAESSFYSWDKVAQELIRNFDAVLKDE
jgi:glycosyltransferase involved in cell wall biosynthesis